AGKCMDKTTEKLARYVTALRYEDLSDVAVHTTKKLLIDAIGCAIGGYHGAPSAIARKLAAETSARRPARILGSGAPTSMEAAAFANAVMVRYLDFNDTYISTGEGHPSDAISAVLAVADAHGLSGKDTLLAMAAAYEVYNALCDAVSLRDKGWDHGYFVVFAAAVGAGKLLGLTLDKMGHAIALAAGPNVPTRQTRSGELSMWKGCACAASARAGVFAALLAKQGMSGPGEAFEGRHGVFDQVTRPFELPPLGGEGRAFGVERTGIKFFPTEYHSQIPLDLALKLREKIAPDDIDRVHAETYNLAWSEIGSEPAKWDPKTRETADHSLPYMLAAALQDGAISIATFDEARIRDPKLRPLMNRIKVSENEEFTRAFPQAMMNRIEIVTKNGEHHVASGRYPRGHGENPLTDAEVEQKYRALCQGLLPDARCEALLNALWKLDTQPEIGAVLERVRIDGA
ncbi:MAG TPA: MmgE/PrpD family protein, partial [Burkholderiales bacterium]|nr:MmgE/PrpD family protein [Burkholderiales bacterium]